MPQNTNILTRKYARQHSQAAYPFARTIKEAFSNKEALWSTILEDVAKELVFQKDLLRDLGDTTDVQIETARRWKFYIETRTPLLKFWSTLFTAFIAMYGLASALIALAFGEYQVSAPWLAVSFIIASALLATLKYIIDKRLAWYEYVLVHLKDILRPTN